MDTNLLRKWLDLPPGDWPPEPRALLGLKKNDGGVQERALALMERLRPHQLRHPELVTEGMNRLAQALIAVEKDEKAVHEINFDPVDLPGPEPSPPLVVLDAEVVEAFPLMDSVPAVVEVKPKPRRKRPKPEALAPVAVPVIAVAEPASVTPDRRQAYRKLARLRRLRRAWERLSPQFGVPSQELLTSGDIFRFLDAAIEARQAIAGLKQWPISQGRLVRTILLHGASLALFCDLQKSQRDLLASDWAMALAEWQAAELSLRKSLRMSKPRQSMHQRLRAATKWSHAHPEWKLGAVLGAAALTALVRTIR